MIPQPLQRHLHYMAVQMGPESVETFNQWIAQHPHFPGIEHLSKGMITTCDNIERRVCADYLQTCHYLAVHSLMEVVTHPIQPSTHEH